MLAAHAWVLGLSWGVVELLLAAHVATLQLAVLLGLQHSQHWEM